MKEVISINVDGLKLLKKRMIDFGRDDFVNYLSEILNISITASSNKMNGISSFKQNEITILTNHFSLTGDEIKIIFVGAD